MLLQVRLLPAQSPGDRNILFPYVKFQEDGSPLLEKAVERLGALPLKEAEDELTMDGFQK